MAFLIPVSCLAAVLSFFCASGLQIHCTSTVPGGCDTAAVDFSNKPEMVLFSSLSGEPLPLKMDLDETVRDDNGEGDGDDDEDDDDEKEDENEDEKKDDKKGNGKGKWCKRELDCLKEGVAQQCSEDSGSYVNRTISWLSVLSTNTTGAAHGMWYSGIPTNPYRPLANQESPDGNGTSAYAHFSGTPLGNPLTTVMQLQPAHSLSQPNGPSFFRLSQFIVDTSASLVDIPLQTVVVQKGTFKDGTCTFNESEPFKRVKPKYITSSTNSSIEVLHGRANIVFGVTLNLTHVTLRVKRKQCLNLVSSSGLPCCCVNKEKKIEVKERCETSEED